MKRSEEKGNVEVKEKSKDTIFAKLLSALEEGTKTVEDLAKIIAESSARVDSVERAKKTVPVRIYNLKKAGYKIEGSMKEGFSLKK